MPGISAECQSGAHEQCSMGFECRCPHHLHTQQLLKKPRPKSDPRGGIRRKLPKEITSQIEGYAEPVLEVQNTCPKCGAKARATDVFCRLDGTRLAVGKQCLACGSPCDPDDKFCWQCGLECGKKPPEPEIESPKEDPVMRLLREAKESGLMKETVIP